MNYYFLFIWLAFMLLLRPSFSYWTVENEYYQIKVTRGFAITAFFPVFYLAVFGPVRGDVWLYLYSYKNLPTNPEEIAYLLSTQDNSQLFLIGEILINRLTNANETAFRLVIGLIQSVAIVLLYHKYSDDYLLSLYLVIASGIPLAWMMNGLRQFVAVAIIIMATPWMLQKKFVKVCIVVLIASLVHQSAIIMLPVVFVVQGQAWNWKTMLAILGAVIAAFVFSNVGGAYESMMDIAGYDMDTYAADDGVNPLRVLVNFIPVFLAFMAKPRLEGENIPIINLSINMSIISFGIYLVAMVTSGILVGRVSIYMSLYTFILLPYLVKNAFTGGISELLKYGMIVFYGLYFYVQYA